MHKRKRYLRSAQLDNQNAKIYAYLSDTLDLSFEISKDLYALYEFIQDRLAEANIKKDAGILSQVLSLTRDFKDTWKKAEIQSRACAHN